MRPAYDARVLILYWMPISSYSAKVRLAGAIKGIEFELRLPPGNSYKSDEYRRINALGTVPALIDQGFILAESDAIIEYVNDLYPEPPLLPDTPRERAKTRFLSRFHDLHLEPHVRALFKHIRPETPDTRAIIDHLSEIQRMLDLLEGFLDFGGPYAVGSYPTLADCAFPPTLAIVDAILPPLGVEPRYGACTQAWRTATGADLRFRSVMADYEREVARWLRGKMKR